MKERFVVEIHDVDGGHRAYVYKSQPGSFDKFLFEVNGLDQHHLFQKIANRWPYIEKGIDLKFLNRTLNRRAD